MEDQVQIRRGRPRDFTTLGRIMYEAVHYGAPLYTPAQRKAWMPHPPSGRFWRARLEPQKVWVCEAGGRGPVGFITLRSDQNIDYAYILRHWQGRGLFGQMYSALEEEAIGEGLDSLWTLASLHARPAFERAGFSVVRPAEVKRAGQTLIRYQMEKHLA